jgi:hypothetical protein
LNDLFRTEDFAVYKLTSGELVTDEWTGKKHTLKSF